MERHEVGRGLELLVKDPPQVERHIDQIGEQLRPEQRPHAPQAEGGGPLRAFDRSQAAVEVGQSRRGRIEQVGRVLLEGLEAMGRIAVEDKRAQGRHEEHLVGVPRHAVGPIESRHEMRDAAG